MQRIIYSNKPIKLYIFNKDASIFLKKSKPNYETDKDIIEKFQFHNYLESVYTLLGGIPDNIYKLINSSKITEKDIEKIDEYYGYEASKTLFKRYSLNDDIEDEVKNEKVGKGTTEVDTDTESDTEGIINNNSNENTDNINSDDSISNITVDYGDLMDYQINNDDQISSDNNYVDMTFLLDEIENEGKEGGDINVDDISFLLNETEGEDDTLETNKGIKVNGIKYFYDNSIKILPYDNYVELKEKIYVLTGIPIYAQNIETETTINNVNDENIFNNSIKIDTIKIMGFKVINNTEDVVIENFDSIYPVFYVNEFLLFNIGNYIDKQKCLNLLNTDKYQFQLLFNGFINLYWPYFSFDSFITYLEDEKSMETIYPNYNINRHELKIRYMNEKEIVDFDIINNIDEEIQNKIQISIVKLTLHVSIPPNFIGDEIMSIRNIFDKFACEDIVLEIRAYVTIDSKQYLLRKININNSIDNVTWPVKQEQTMDYLIMMIQYEDTLMFLVINENKDYYIVTSWYEEDNMTFKAIFEIVKTIVQPIIDKINDLRFYIFNNNNDFLAPIKESLVTYTDQSTSILYKKIFLDSDFKKIKTLWNPYLKSNILVLKEFTNSKHEFIWRKGMYEFDFLNLKRLLNVSEIKNYYHFFTSESMYQKYLLLINKRLMKLSQRTTDIKFEIHNVNENEFRIFYNFIIMFIFRINMLKGLNKNEDNEDTKKIKKLKEQDPELYNLKKYNSDFLYSKKCQKKRQPLIYTDEEYNKLNDREKKSITKYWNFTFNKHNYYECPDKKYPYVNFITGLHPKNYCMVCCGKSLKKNNQYNKCIQDHFYDDSEKVSSNSRHIIMYGKEIEIGRLSKLSTQLLKVFENENSNSEYYLFGTEQINSNGYLGILYSTAFCLEIPYEGLIIKIIDTLKLNKHFFIMSVTEENIYADELIDIFNSLLTDQTLMKDLSVKDNWNLIVIECMILLNIHYITFVDENIYIHPKTMILIRNNNITNNKFILLNDIDGLIYPIVEIVINEFYKDGSIKTKLYSDSDYILHYVTEGILKYINDVKNKDNQNFSLQTIQNFVNNHREYKIIMKYINQHNLCYAVLLSITENNRVIYIPCQYSLYGDDLIEISYDLVKIDKIYYEDVMNFIKAFNEESETESVIIVKDIQIVDKNIFNFNENTQLDAKTNGDLKFLHVTYNKRFDYLFYFTNVDDKGGNFKDIKVKNTLDVYDINNEILNSETNYKFKNIGYYLYINNIYKLYITEILTFISKGEYNIALAKYKEKRTLVLDFINYKYNYIYKNGDISNDNFIKPINEEKKQNIKDVPVRKYSKDKFIKLLKEYISKNDDKSIRDMMKEINESIIIKDKVSKTINFPNVYVSCKSINDKEMYCQQNKLIIDNSININKLIDLFVNDVKNNVKFELMFNIHNVTSNVINYFDFTVFTNEKIFVYDISNFK